MRKTEKVLGYDVDLLTFSGAIDKIMGKIHNQEGAQVVTINPEMIEMASRSYEFSKILKSAEIVIPDSSGIKLALKLKGVEQEQIPGIDLALDLLRSCCEMNYKVALIGATEDVLETTVKRVKGEFEGIKICYSRNGYFDIQKEDKIIEELKASEPNLVLVAMGVPRQEFFIKSCKEKISNAVFIGVGGSFDVWAGVVQRAPEFFKVMGCEWLYRTYKQPQRIKRIYKTLPLFLIKVIIDAIQTNGIFLKRKKND